MNKLWVYFILGALLSPILLTFGKIVIFVAGLIAIVWVINVVKGLNEEEEDNDHRVTDGP